MRRAFSFDAAPVALSVASGAVVPDGRLAGARLWSTLEACTLEWDGSAWRKLGAGADRNYVHQQAIPSDVWVVPHGLGKIPAITVIDSAGDEVRGEVRHDSTTQSTITFAFPFSGAAHCN